MSLLRWLCGVREAHVKPTTRRTKKRRRRREDDDEEVDCLPQDTHSGSLTTSKLSDDVNSLNLANLLFVTLIGNGSFGKVYLAKDAQVGRLYAVKIMNLKGTDDRGPNEHECRQIWTEHRILSSVAIDSPFIVRHHCAIRTDDKLYLIMDYINGGELHSHLKRFGCFSESKAMFYAAELTCALGYLHRKNVIYRDLKPENILINSEGHLVLIDFGLCKESKDFDAICTTICGTSEYLAPEIIRKVEYTRSVDWWCLGLVLYEMLYGQKPFYSHNILIMYENVVNKPPRLRDTVSTAARDILSKLLQKDPASRLGSGPGDDEEIKGHTFFKKLDWDDVENVRLPAPFKPSKDVLKFSQLDCKSEIISNNPKNSRRSIRR